MEKRIYTTHVGSLPRIPALLDANRARAQGTLDAAGFGEVLRRSVGEVVRHQHELGLDIVNEGEYSHTTATAVGFATTRSPWWDYCYTRLGGFTRTNVGRFFGEGVKRSTPGHIELTSFSDRRDRGQFRAAYEDSDLGVMRSNFAKVCDPKVTGPIKYIGQTEIAMATQLLRGALQTVGAQHGFMPAASPGTVAQVRNEYYGTDREYVMACAEAMSVEYKLIVDAGFTVQIDDPTLAAAWDQINPEPSVVDYCKFIRLRVDAINHALKLQDIPPERVRLHVCWGSWHGPHVTDVPFNAIVDEVLRAKVGGILFEASSPRHAHEWRVWRDHTLPTGMKLYPGVVSHCTNIVEHPQLVADRIVRFAELVGPENVVASTDCGLGGRLHEQIAWAKLGALVDGAQLASRELYGNAADER